MTFICEKKRIIWQKQKQVLEDNNIRKLYPLSHILKRTVQELMRIDVLLPTELKDDWGGEVSPSFN